MSSYRRILYHIVINTKHRKETLSLEYSEELYAYILGIVRNKNCFLYRINGMGNHIHMLTDLHPSLALADYIRDMKVASSLWLKSHPGFPVFEGWSDGYAALTYSWRDKDMIVNYIKNQREHHKKECFEDEFRRLLIEQGITIDEKYLFL